jgi:hypothetical protein
LLQAGSDDEFEPNGPCDSAAALNAGEHAGLVVKSVDEDWYRIHVPDGATLSLTIDSIQVFGRVQLQLFDACGSSPLRTTDALLDSESVAFTNPEDDADYLIRVHLLDDVRNSYDLSAAVIVHAPPPNDSCADAAELTQPEQAFTTLGATTDGPEEPLACSELNRPQLLRDIWYRYTAPCSGVVTVTTCGRSFDTALPAYGSACPTAVDSAIVCNDQNAACGEQAEIRFGVSVGAEYLLRVGGEEGSSGNGLLSVVCNACPADVVQTGLGAGIVDIDDLLAVINSWNATGGPVDVVPDRMVNIDDLLAVIGSWGPCR